MKDKKKKCSGFPEKPGACSNLASATVMGARQQVCEEHGKQATANGFHVKPYVRKKS